MRVANLVFATATLGCIVSTRPASAQVVFGQDNINSYAHAVAYAGDGSDGGVSNSSQPYGGPPTFSPSRISSNAEAFAMDGVLLDASGFAEANGTVVFNSAAAGQVQFTGLQQAVSDNANGLAYATGGGFFNYSFETPTPGATFNVSYNLSSANIGCCGGSVSLQDLNTGNYVFYQTIYGASNAGLLTANLTADNYDFTISDPKYPYYDGATAIGVAESYVNYDDRYSFTISAVSGAPEPSSWALMIAGVGLVGGVLRRRRTSAAVPSETAIAA